jgi:glycine cleavage system H protein
MSNIPSNLKYTKSHEWVRAEADGSITVGITEHAQDLLGDMVFVENPVVGRQLAAGEECAVVESVKAASDVYAPVAGVVLASNADVEASPESINKDAYAAWMYTMKPANVGDLDGLMDAAGYAAHVASESH